MRLPLNPVLGVVLEVVAEHSNVLPAAFAISLPSDLWAELWRRPIAGRDGKPVAPCARICFMPGGFRVTISEEDMGDPPDLEH